MLLSRSTARLTRLRRPYNLRETLRLSSSTPKTSVPRSGLSSNQLWIAGTLTGSTLLGGYAWYRSSGVRNAVYETNDHFVNVSKDSTDAEDVEYNPEEALQWLRKTALLYATVVPGGKAYVDTALANLDKVHEKYSGKVELIVRGAYSDMKVLVKEGDWSIDAVQKAWEILQKTFKKIEAVGKKG